VPKVEQSGDYTRGLNKQAQQRVPSVGIHSECDAQKLYLIKYKSYSFRKAYRKRKT